MKELLVFDDNENNLNVAKQAYSALKDDGINVTTTSSLDDALDKINSGRISILVADLMVPGKQISPQALKEWIGLTDKTRQFFQSHPELLRCEYNSYVGGKVYTANHPGWQTQVEIPIEFCGSPPAPYKSWRQAPSNLPFEDMLTVNQEKIAADKQYPIGIVLYHAAEKDGIEANIVTDTHRHRLKGTSDIRGDVLPLLVEYPTLVVKIEDFGYIDPAKIRSNTDKKNPASWFYGGGYEKAYASFLPQRWKDLDYQGRVSALNIK